MHYDDNILYKDKFGWLYYITNRGREKGDGVVQDGSRITLFIFCILKVLLANKKKKKKKCYNVHLYGQQILEFIVIGYLFNNGRSLNRISITVASKAIHH